VAGTSDTPRNLDSPVVLVAVVEAGTAAWGPGKLRIQAWPGWLS
jgi:hypothetical protein